jgi:tripartite-type tricarboxylate transporter receptor subunit TctC
MTRRLAVLAGIASLTGLVGPGIASAAGSNFPSRTVTIVAAFPPGGTVDLLARVLAPKLSEAWGQPVVVENRPGGSGIVGSQTVTAAAPDGHTLMLIPITHVTNASLLRSLPFDPIKDFTPITLIASQPMMLVVNQSSPIRSVGDLISEARSRPGRLNCGSGGNGTSQHLACELFKSMTQVDITHVPYRGNAAAMTDVISGQIQLLFDQMATAVPHVRDGRVRALAVTTEQRSLAMPQVPTVAETGVPGYETTAWFGMVGPARMPAELASQIQTSIAQALSLPDVKALLAAQGLTLVGSSPDEFASTLVAELHKWAKVIKASGARAD